MLWILVRYQGYLLEMRQRACNFGSAKRPRECSEGNRQQDSGENQQGGERRPQVLERGMAEERGTHAFQSVSNGYEAGDVLQPGRQYGYRIHHPAHHR